MTDRGKPALPWFEYRPDGPVRSLDANLPNSDEVCDACGGSETFWDILKIADIPWHPDFMNQIEPNHQHSWNLMKLSWSIKHLQILFDLQHWVACEVPRPHSSSELVVPVKRTFIHYESCRLVHEHQKHSKRQEGHEVLWATVALWMLSSTCNFFIFFIWFHLSAYDRMQKEFISHLLVAPGSRFNGRMLEYVRTADISRSSQLLGHGAPPGLPTQRWDVAWLALLWKSLTEFCIRIYLYMDRYG